MTAAPYRVRDAAGVVWELSGRWGEGFRRVTPERLQARGDAGRLAPDADLAWLAAALKVSTR